MNKMDYFTCKECGYSEKKIEKILYLVCPDCFKETGIDLDKMTIIALEKQFALSKQSLAYWEKRGNELR